MTPGIRCVIQDHENCWVSILPSYSYECKCGKSFDDIRRIADRAKAPCPVCGAAADKIVGPRSPAVHGFKFGYFENIEREPVYAKSKKHLRELCNRNECYAPGVLD